MALTTEPSLKDIIQERLQASLVQVEDMSGGCGQAFAVVIVLPFRRENKLMRHRLVNSAPQGGDSGDPCFHAERFHAGGVDGARRGSLRRRRKVPQRLDGI